MMRTRALSVAVCTTCSFLVVLSLARAYEDAPQVTSSSDLGPTYRASDLRGMVVKNPANENLGKVEDLVLDLKSGNIRYTRCG